MVLPSKDDELRFEKEWEEARVRFQRLTEKSIKPGREKSLDEILRELDRHFAADDTVAVKPKKKRVKELVYHVIDFINLLGGIVAGGASVAFGPASTCFSALQFLMAIPKKIDKFYDNLALLFEEIATFMKQFKIYRRAEQFATIDVELKDGTHKLMICFVDICALSISKLSDSWLKTLGTQTKLVLFDNDSGVSAKLEEFRRLIKFQSQISDAVSLEHILMAQRNTEELKDVLGKNSEDIKDLVEVFQSLTTHSQAHFRDAQIAKDTIVSMEAKQRKDEERNQHLKYIVKELGINDDGAGALKQRADFDTMQQRSLRTTGEWLSKVGTFRAWKTDHGERTPLLFLTGNAGSGASHLLSVIKHMLEAPRHMASNLSKVVVACYAFERRTKKLGKATGNVSNWKSTVTDALESIVYQLALDDDNYSKDLALDLRGYNFGPLSPEALSTYVLPPRSTKASREFTYYLLIDNITHLSEADAKVFLKSITALRDPRIRCVIAATDELLRSNLEVFDQDVNSIPTIKLEECNQTDIKEYIEHKLMSHGILQDGNESVDDVVSSIREKLPNLAAGNFNNVDIIIQAVLDGMSQELSVKDIKSLLREETITEQKDAPARLIQQLNDELNGQQIEQVNELLMWVIYSEDTLSLRQCRAAIFLKSRRQPWKALENRINGQYRSILKLEYSGRYVESEDNTVIGLKDPCVEEYLRAAPRKEVKVDGESSRFSLEIKIENATLPQIQRFVWDLNEKVTLQRFVFDSPEKGSAKKPRIEANPVDSHLTLARRHFDLLFGSDPDPCVQSLIQLAPSSLIFHLTELRDEGLERLTAEERQEIGRKLVRLLRNPENFEESLSFRFISRAVWFHPRSLAGISLWMQDPFTLEGADPQDRNWIRSLGSQSLVAPLKPTTQMMARKWLCETELNAHALFKWIDKFTSLQVNSAPIEERGNEKVEQTRPTRKKVPGTKIDEQLTFRQRVHRALEWAKEEAQCREVSALWFERVGLVCYEDDEFARDAYLEAKQFPSYNLSVSRQLVWAYSRCGQIEEAIEESKTLISALKQNPSKSDEEIKTLGRDLTTEAFLHMKLNHLDDAVLKLREALELRPFFYYNHCNLLRIYINTGRTADAIQHLRELSVNPGVEADETQLAAVLKNAFTSKAYNPLIETVFHSCKGDDMFQTVLNALEKNLEKAEERKDLLQELNILLWKGIGLAKYATDGNPSIEALQLLEKSFRLAVNTGTSDYSTIARMSAIRIVNSRFTLWVSTGNDPDELEVHVSKLKDMISRSAARYPNTVKGLKNSLSCMYAIAGRYELSRDMLRMEMRSAIDLLSDDDPGNDHWGLRRMAKVLARSGHDLDALTAWSLIGPFDKDRVRERILQSKSETNPSEHVETPEQGVTASRFTEGVRRGPIAWECDGGCDKVWTYANNFYDCKICSNMEFCPECLTKLKNGTLSAYVCGADHSFFHVPPWSDEDYLDVGPDHVWVGGELIDGKRVGGTVTTTEKWMDNVKEQWGLN